MVIAAKKSSVPPAKPFPWLPRGRHKEIEVVRNRGGLGDFLQILAACEELQKQSGAKVTLIGPRDFVCLGAQSPVIIRPPRRNIKRTSLTYKIRNGVGVFLDYPCPAPPHEHTDKPLSRLDIFHRALGVEPNNPRFRLAQAEKTKAAKWCMDKTGSENPIVFVYRSAERRKNYAYAKELFGILKKDYPIVLVENLNEPNIQPSTHGLSLREHMAVINQARIVVAPDTGWLHAAGLLRRPIFGLFGSQDPKYRQDIYKVRGSYLQGICPYGKQPCWYDTCGKRDEYMPCMMTPAKVVATSIENTLQNLHTHFYFYHIPKTGGGTIRAALTGSPTVKMAEGEYPHRFDDEICGDAQPFTVIRNPIDRAVSAFTWLRNNGDNHAWFAYLRSVDPNKFFEDEAVLTTLANEANDSMFYSQSNRLRDIGRDDIEIYRYEDGLDTIAKRFEANLPTERVHESKRKPKLSKAAKDTLLKVYKDDWALWVRSARK